MPTEKMQPVEYAKKRGISKQAVHEAMKHKEEGKTYYLPGVTKIEKFSRFYILTVKVNDKGEIAE